MSMVDEDEVSYVAQLDAAVATGELHIDEDIGVKHVQYAKIMADQMHKAPPSGRTTAESKAPFAFGNSGAPSAATAAGATAAGSGGAPAAPGARSKSPEGKKRRQKRSSKEGQGQGASAPAPPVMTEEDKLEVARQQEEVSHLKSAS